MWYAKPVGAYGKESDEALANCRATYARLSSFGWTVNAVCGVLGNVANESGYNPWRWQSDTLGYSTGAPWTNKGYGLVQFTPGGKYISNPNAQSYSGYGPNFSDRAGNQNDGDAQLEFINFFADYAKTSSYPLDYEEYKKSTENAGWLAGAWLYNYERPGDPEETLAKRQEDALYWYSILSGEEPEPPAPQKTKNMKWIYYMRRTL